MTTDVCALPFAHYTPPDYDGDQVWKHSPGGHGHDQKRHGRGGGSVFDVEYDEATRSEVVAAITAARKYDLSTWEAIRPWDKSHAEIAAGAVPGLSASSAQSLGVDRVAGEVVAQNRNVVDGTIQIRPGWDAMDGEGRKALLYHEVGHDVARVMLADGSGQRVLEPWAAGRGLVTENRWGLSNRYEEALSDAFVIEMFSAKAFPGVPSLYDRTAGPKDLSEKSASDRARVVYNVGKVSMALGYSPSPEARSAMDLYSTQTPVQKLATRLLKHSPGGHGHDQKAHGRRAGAARPDWADEFESVGGRIDADGSVLLYHATTKDKAAQILRQGVLRRPADAPDSYGVYVSSSQGVSADYGDGTLVPIRVQVADLQPDDVFSNRMDFSIPTRAGTYRPQAVGDAALKTPVRKATALAERLLKHSPGGQSHRQLNHGRRFATAREFAGDEGYAWAAEHEAWAAALPQDVVGTIVGYASFGYADTNSLLRGEVLTKPVTRSATHEELTELREWQRRGSVGPRPEPKDGEWYGMDVLSKVPDTERMDRVRAEAKVLNDVFDKHGVEVTEMMAVNRAAYIPGMTGERLEALKGKTIREKGFTSTMVGDPGGRLDSYVAGAKAESLHRRTGKVDGEYGTSPLRVKIRIPPGTKVIPVEAVRRYGSRGDRDRGTEAEVLLRSGARFRVADVKLYAGRATWSNYQTSYHEVTLDYIG